ncbi:MAG: sortase [Anaerolineae bacterium]|nr:sortase [Anaerolineae bacterium]
MRNAPAVHTLAGGVLLLLVGAMLLRPYLGSRLANLPTAPVQTLTHTPPARPVVVTTRAKPTAFSPLQEPVQTPWPTVSPTPAPAIPTRIVIPAIGVDAPVVPVSVTVTIVEGQEYTTWAVPDMYAAGWHNTSAPPGVPGNTVLNGHNTTYGEVFRDLYRLKEGDSITVYAGESPYTYTVSSVLILPEAGQPIEVRLQNARYILPTEDERLTLVTCHPYGSLRYRLLIIALPDGADRGGKGEP